MSSSDTTTSTSSNLNQYVKLNVGGHFFQTTIGTLMSQEGMLKNMFKGDFENKKDSDGFVMIDRDGEIFSEILNFLRKGSISLSRPKNELESILAEAEFYQIGPLISSLKKKLSSLEERKFIPSNFHLTMTKKAALPPTSSKPVICLALEKMFNVHAFPQEFSIFKSFCEKYSDVFEFVLNFNQETQGFFWYVKGGGCEGLKFPSMKSNSVVDSPMTEFFAQVLRKPKANNSNSPN